MLCIVYTHGPDPRGRCFKAHKDKLAAGLRLNELVVYRYGGGVQKKGDRSFIIGDNRDTANPFSAGGDKAYGIGVCVNGPKLQHEAAPGLLLSHPDLHILPFLIRRYGFGKMMGHTRFIASGDYRYDAEKASVVLSHLA